MIDQKQKNELAISLAWRELAVSIFRQAAYDCRNPELEPQEQADALDWLEREGYEYLTGLLGLELAAGDYMNFIERIQENDTPIMFVGREPEPVKQKANNPLQGLCKVRAQKSDNRHWKNVQFYLKTKLTS